MMDRLAAGAMAGLHVNANRLRARLGEENGQGTVEYAGLAMAIGVLLIAVGSYLGGKDHGIGSVMTLGRSPSAALTFAFTAVQVVPEFTSRVCTGCGVQRSLDAFHKHQFGKGGVRPRCKGCVRADDTRRASTGSTA